MSEDDKGFSLSERTFWWVRFWTAVIVVAGMGLAGARWGLTRASLDDVALKEDKTFAAEQRSKIEAKVDAQGSVIGNVRDNLIVIMSRQGLQPVPLPDPLPKVTP